jgi:hypothetical protein
VAKLPSLDPPAEVPCITITVRGRTTPWGRACIAVGIWLLRLGTRGIQMKGPWKRAKWESVGPRIELQQEQ